MKKRIALAVLLLAVACAGTSTFEQRLAELERRVSALAAVSDAGISDGDASVAPALQADAMAIGDVDASRLSKLADAGLDGGGLRGPHVMIMSLEGVGLEGCLAQAAQKCQGAVLRSIHGNERADGGLEWRRKPAAVRAEDHPVGRACLGKEEARCRADPLHYHSAAVLKRWLDKQLTPARIDKQATADLRELIARNTGAYASDAAPPEVECVKEFCRVRSTGGAFKGSWDELLAGLDAPRVLFFHGADHWYVSRGDWDFPAGGRSMR